MALRAQCPKRTPGARAASAPHAPARLPARRLSARPARSPGSRLSRPARARLGSTGVRGDEARPGCSAGYRRALKATVSATAAAATPHPSESGPGAAP